MGLRDRLRGFIGRERPATPALSVVSAPATGPAPPSVAAPVPVGPDGLVGARIVDVRAASAFSAGHLPGARLLAQADVRAFARSANGPVVVVCEDGVVSSGVAERLAALGVARVGWLVGGMGAHAGPVEAP